LARRACTVVLGRPVVRPEVLWGQGTARRLARADAPWGEGGMRGEGLAMGQWTGETGRARPRCGRKGGGPLQGHPPLGAEAPHGGEQAGRCQARKDLDKDGRERAWGDRLEPRAALLLTGPRRDPHQGLHVLGPLGWGQPARSCQKRRRWGEKDATSAPGSVWDSVSGVGTLVAVVRQGRAPAGQEALADIEASRVGHDALLGAGAMSPSPCRCPLATVNPWQANIRMAACA
jgi:hypothetical protein